MKCGFGSQIRHRHSSYQAILSTQHPHCFPAHALVACISLLAFLIRKATCLSDSITFLMLVYLFLCRLAEINKARELDIKLQVKEKEIALALKVEREMKLTQWLKTAARPPLLWLPAVHTEDTKLLLDQRLTDVTAWRVRTACYPL